MAHQVTNTATPPARTRVLTHRSEGQFNPAAWIKEGEHLFASAKVVRASWTVRRKKLSRNISRKTPSARAWAELEGLPKASVLLLGYAIEMFLKAGLSKAYAGCPETLFDRDLRRYSHNFKKLAKALAFEATVQDKQDLNTLHEMVLYDARYPVKPDARNTAIELQAERASVIWSKAEFTRLRHLVLRVKAHVFKIDRDSMNPCSVTSIAMDDDGYVVYRVGGWLPPRVTYRFSTAQIAAGEATREYLKALAEDGQLALLSHYWGQAEFFEDDLGRDPKD